MRLGASANRAKVRTRPVCVKGARPVPCFTAATRMWPVLAVDCGYYFFRSDGTRVKNKWDKMDFDALLAEADSDNEDGASKPRVAKNSPQRAAEGVVQEAKAVAHRLEKVTAVVDQVR